MRGRAVGLVLLGLGTFMLVAALAVRFVLVPELVKVDLDQSATPTAIADDLTYFDLGTLQPVTNDEGRANQTVQGDPNAPEADPDTAVWSSGTSILSSRGDILTTTEFRVCLDRRTAEAVGNCGSASVDGEPADIQGLTITFPIGTEQRDYTWFNSTVGQSFPARYEGEDTVQGLDVYRFVTEVPATTIRQEEVPAALAGAPGDGNVTADVVYSNVRTMLVEPTTGVIISATESPNVVFQGPDGETGITYLSGDFTANEQTVATQVDLASDKRDQIRAVTTTAPIALGVLGLLLLVGGLLLFLRAGRGGDVAAHDRHAEADEDDREFFQLQGR
ncbi:DUF3068 domain-containing protein [Modestobacter sp. I12A-02628]|uniref:DUF3068 domain-containing protein n=1 Tax=Goekera deserti TaxID=2497753 RepID=A0A7K3WCZ9_9ACTN|nr:DUF3068 domain-containing protein [Goekera deserti]MPQ97016.1 DUF3068 domain-containing protein [Goekera deserti]NDI46668.1 DUF3068 domain-containing protein [Goekera deserti]NEL54237.1 DUF3068 domain-containing protein [Goekera deserti]